MEDNDQSTMIEDNPIGKGLDNFRASFQSTYDNEDSSCLPDAVDQLDQGRETSESTSCDSSNCAADLRTLSFDLLLALQSSEASRLHPAIGRGKNPVDDLSRLNSSLRSDDFDLNRTKPLLIAVLAENLSDSNDHRDGLFRREDVVNYHVATARS